MKDITRFEEFFMRFSIPYKKYAIADANKVALILESGANQYYFDPATGDYLHLHYQLIRDVFINGKSYKDKKDGKAKDV